MLAVVISAGTYRATHHRHLSASRTARALERRVHATTTYRCRHISNDGTIVLHDVYYQCDPANPKATGYWVAVDAHRITGTQPLG